MGAMAPTSSEGELEPNIKRRGVPTWLRVARDTLQRQQVSLPYCFWALESPTLAEVWQQWQLGRATLLNNADGELYTPKWICTNCKVKPSTQNNWIVESRCKRCDRLKNAFKLTKKYIRSIEWIDERCRMITLTLPADEKWRYTRFGATPEIAKKEMLRLLRNLRKTDEWSKKVKGHLWSFECPSRPASFPMEVPHRSVMDDWQKENQILNPHLHIICHGEYWEWAKLIELCEKIGFGRSTDIRSVSGVAGVKYACKRAIFYVSKEASEGRTKGTGGVLKETARVIEAIRKGKSWNNNRAENIPSWCWNEQHWEYDK